jgi:hypothetical protein
VRRAIQLPDPAVLDGLVVAEEPSELIEKATRLAYSHQSDSNFMRFAAAETRRDS